MEQRTILYGYSKNQFRYYINESESTVIKTIFSEYIDGKTLQQIADRLTEEQIVYYKDKTLWNKHMVRRVIENRCYVGDENYPAIISHSEYEQANKKRLSRGGTRITDTEQEKYFKGNTYCGQCGNRFTRRRNWSKTHEKWYCTYGCKNTVYIDDRMLFGQVLSIINRIISQPQLLNVIGDENDLFIPTPEVMRAEKEIERMIERKNTSFLPIRTAIYSNVYDKFDCCMLNKAKAFSEILLHYYSEQSTSDTVNIQLLKDSVEKVLVDRDGNVTIEFLNGCQVSKEDEHGCDYNTKAKDYNENRS